MKPAAISGRRFARQRDMGWDGLATLLLSNALLLATLGLSGLWWLRRVWRIARDTPCAGVIAHLPPLQKGRTEQLYAGMEGHWVVVLGARLQHDQVAIGYARRLRRAAALYQADPQRRILLVGGHTGGSVSEAERGRAFLLDLGIPDSHLMIEDQSLNTLDNLRHARRMLPDLREQPFILVSSRYHLARGQALALGLGLRPVLCAAEEHLRRNLWTLWRLILEAYYLHWYAVGKSWSRWTGNRHSLARIS